MNRENYPFPLYPLVGDVVSTPGQQAVTVTQIQSIPVEPGTPTDGQLLRYNAITAQWQTENNSFAASIGDGVALSYLVNHNLHSTDVQVTVFDNATLVQVLVEAQITDVDNVTIVFTVAPTTDAYRVVVER